MRRRGRHLTLASSFALLSPLLVGVASADSQESKVINVTRTQGVFHDGEDVIFYALRSHAGVCDRLEVDVDGVIEERSNVVFPYTLVVHHGAKAYPSKDGTHTITLRGKSGNCTGSVSTTFV